MDVIAELVIYSDVGVNHHSGLSTPDWQSMSRACSWKGTCFPFHVLSRLQLRRPQNYTRFVSTIPDNYILGRIIVSWDKSDEPCVVLGTPRRAGRWGCLERGATVPQELNEKHVPLFPVWDGVGPVAPRRVRFGVRVSKSSPDYCPFWYAALARS